MKSGVEQRVSSLDRSLCESREQGVWGLEVASGLAGLMGEGRKLYSWSRGQCPGSGEAGWGVGGLVPQSRGVVRPSMDLYDLSRPGEKQRKQLRCFKNCTHHTPREPYRNTPYDKWNTKHHSSRPNYVWPTMGHDYMEYSRLRTRRKQKKRKKRLFGGTWRAAPLWNRTVAWSVAGRRVDACQRAPACGAVRAPAVPFGAVRCRSVPFGAVRCRSVAQCHKWEYGSIEQKKEKNMIRQSVDYRQDLTNQIRLCKFLVGDTPSTLYHFDKRQDRRSCQDLFPVGHWERFKLTDSLLACYMLNRNQVHYH